VDRCVFLVHRFCLGLFCAGEDVTRPHVPAQHRAMRTGLVGAHAALRSARASLTMTMT
jgi:hypothetical protein